MSRTLSHTPLLTDAFLPVRRRGAVGRLGGSDTDSVGSSAKSMEGSPTASPLPPPRRTHTVSSGDELETDPDTGEGNEGELSVGGGTVEGEKNREREMLPVIGRGMGKEGKREGGRRG